MRYQNRIVRRFCFALGLAVVLLAPTFTSAKPTNGLSSGSATRPSARPPTTLNLSDFGAVGDGIADDGPAIQGALDALAEAGGGTLLVPAGTYFVATPVVKDFSSVPDAIVAIEGVPSATMPAPPTASGEQLSLGLNLTSRIIPATGPDASALKLTNLRELTIEHIDFTGRPEARTDAFVSLYLVEIGKATLRHCEFYGLSSLGISDTEGGGNIVRAVRSQLSIELSVFLGCTANSGAYAAVVTNREWRKFSISNSIFLDYGQRAFFGKTGIGAPLSWIDIGNAAFPTPESPRREFVVRDTFLDEGGWVGISALPYRWGPYSKIDLLYISGLKMNVANMGTTGHLLYDIENLFIENSHYGWSQNAYAAIDIYRVGNAIYDKLNCIDHANRLTADSLTGRLTVINSNYAQLDSDAQITNVVSSAPEEDPVQYVRNQFVSTLDRPPDPAAHFYWSDLLIRCGGDTDCLDQQRAALSEYLSRSPQSDFSIAGTVTDESGAPLNDAVITLTGSQSATAVADAQGAFQFSELPTSGSYTVSVNKPHYSFATSSYTFVRPAATVIANFSGQLIRHNIQGRIAKPNGNGLSGVTVQLAQSPDVSVITDDHGNYVLSALPEGGTYTVVPVLTNFIFTPENQTFADLSADQTVNFAAQQTSFVLAGRVSDDSGTGISGATVTLTGTAAASALTDFQGNFRFLNLPTNGSYTVSVSKQHYSFVPGSHTFSNPLEDLTVEFDASLKHHRINGRIVGQHGTALSGVTVQLNESMSITTDANGYYSFPELAAGDDYVITPVSNDFTFTPVSKTFADLGADQTADFSGALQRISLSGRVADANGNLLVAVDVTLSGSQSGTTTTNSTGNFQFVDLPTSGTYTVSVSKRHYSFATSSRTFEQPSDHTTVDFTGNLNRHAISGRITRTNGNGIGGVTLQLAQSPATSALTDANGYYSFPDLPAGANYTVTPASTDFTFTPAAQSFEDLSANQSANFTGLQTDFLLAGSIEDENGNPLDGATVTAVGPHSASTLTDQQGSFRFLDLPTSGTYTVTVSKRHYTFLQSSHTLSNPTEDVSVEFQGTLNRHNLNGRIVKPDGTGMSGVTVQLGQSAETSVMTDANGYYSFTALRAGQNYLILPSSSAFFFTPANQAFEDLGADGTANFVGKLGPRIMTTDGSDSAIALDSISLMAGPFSILSSLGFSSDGFTRLVIFATDVPTTDLSQLSLVAEDDAGTIYPLAIEQMTDVRDQAWLKQINFKLSQNLPSAKCVWLRLSVGNVSSNEGKICLSP